MTADKFSKALGNIGDTYIQEAAGYTGRKRAVWVKWSALAACAALIIAILAAAVDFTGKQAIVPAEYKLLLYDNMLSGYDDTYTERVSGRFLRNERLLSALPAPDKTVTLFGKTYNFAYDETLTSKRWANHRVDYLAKDPEAGTLVLAGFDAKTGALMSFADSEAGKNRDYVSEVNAFSSEAEFLEYAKMMVSQHASVEGCAVEITTRLYEYDAEYGRYMHKQTLDGYVNNRENAADFYAIYQFEFYKQIDGIRRFDTNVIEICDTGEVQRLSFNMQNTLYTAFADVKVDLAQGEQLAKEALAKFVYCDSVQIAPSLVATTDGELWLHLDVYAQWGGGTSGYTYVIKVASLQ